MADDRERKTLREESLLDEIVSVSKKYGWREEVYECFLLFETSSSLCYLWRFQCWGTIGIVCNSFLLVVMPDFSRSFASLCLLLLSSIFIQTSRNQLTN
jgi:hypothetical protein